MIQPPQLPAMLTFSEDRNACSLFPLRSTGCPIVFLFTWELRVLEFQSQEELHIPMKSAAALLSQEQQTT
jgi:hypothetical protein